VLTAERSPEQPNGFADAELSRWIMQGQHCQAMYSTPDLGGGNWKDSAGDGRQPESRKSKMVGGGRAGCAVLSHCPLPPRFRSLQVLRRTNEVG